MQTLLRDLNHAYAANRSLHAKDCVAEGFRWSVIDDDTQSVFAYLRLGDPGDAPVLAVCNFTPVPRYDYRIGVPQAGVWQEILNTDASHYGGSGLGNGGAASARAEPFRDFPASLALTLPPLAMLILRAD